MTLDSKILRTFVIIFQGRCGSTYLVEALDAHPEIECTGENFAALKKQKHDAHDQLEWAKCYLTTAESPQTLEKGFKTKLRDVLDLPGFKELIQSLSTRIIHLRRRNVVKLTISSFNSVRLKHKTGDWNLYKSTDRLPETVIDLETFASWLGSVEERAVRELSFVERLELPTLTAFYEDFLVNSTKYFEAIFSFLDLPFYDVKGRAIKSTSDDLRLAISNFEELKSNYKGTRYEWMFDEVISSQSGSV